MKVAVMTTGPGVMSPIATASNSPQLLKGYDLRSIVKESLFPGLVALASTEGRSISARGHEGTMRLPIAWKFFALLAAIVPSLVAVSWVGDRGLTSMQSRLDTVYDDALTTSHIIGGLSTHIEEAEQVALRLIVESDPHRLASLRAELVATVVPEVTHGLQELRAAPASATSSGDLALLDQLDQRWRAFVDYTTSVTFDSATSGRFARDRVVSAAVERLAIPLTGTVSAIAAAEQRQAFLANQAADRTYGDTRRLLRILVAVGLLAGIGATLALSRNVVRRVRAYSGFAKRVAAGDVDTYARPIGHDELTDLGRALNTMVTRGESARLYEQTQAEFTEAMQVTQSEDEAYGLLKRHIERSIQGTDVVTLNRNNSADRLEAVSIVEEGCELSTRLAEAQPRDCLAVRLARSHRGEPSDDSLISCKLCTGIPGFSMCSPLLVGGEVTGSVLVTRPEGMSDDERVRINDSVGRAAPVLANLRNLAIAELRAATDQLTGLPNARAVQDTMKRLVAQAARMAWPLTAILFDLDHFKQINDTYGHPKGDEVLAAVGAALQVTMRESDFVGRYGGEEFVMLLPSTDKDAGVQVAERVRTAIAAIEVVAERKVTASFGVAVFPENAADADRLLRNADRALYRAKANGRNRVEVFSLERQDDAVAPSERVVQASIAHPGEDVAPLHETVGNGAPVKPR